MTIPGTETLTAAYEVMLPAGSYRLRVRLVEAHTRMELTAWAARDFTVVHCRFTLSGSALRRATVGQVKPKGRSRVLDVAWEALLVAYRMLVVARCTRRSLHLAFARTLRPP